MSLQGADELRARFRALRGAAQPILRRWGEDTRRLAAQRLATHSKTGATARTLTVEIRDNRAIVSARRGARYVERDTKQHVIRPKRFQALKFNARTGPVFARKVVKPRRSGTPFLANSARDALSRGDYAREIEKLWDDAA